MLNVERIQAVKSQLTAYLWVFPGSVSTSVETWDVQTDEVVPANSQAVRETSHRVHTVGFSNLALPVGTPACGST